MAGSSGHADVATLYRDEAAWEEIARDHARRADSDSEVELLGAAVCAVRDDRITSVEFYASREDALEAAGLEHDAVER